MTLAWIDEARCIGCTLCIQACPVDAIVGAPKRMHTVLAAHCTGCDLCLPPCPVDCIEVRPAATEPCAMEAATRRQARLARLARTARPRVSETASRWRKTVIEAALARTRAKRAAGTRA